MGPTGGDIVARIDWGVSDTLWMELNVREHWQWGNDDCMGVVCRKEDECNDVDGGAEGGGEAGGVADEEGGREGGGREDGEVFDRGRRRKSDKKESKEVKGRCGGGDERQSEHALSVTPVFPGLPFLVM
ncbi:hypothetical protein Lser_V15G07293 [Lactuca serriola]